MHERAGGEAIHLTLIDSRPLPGMGMPDTKPLAAGTRWTIGPHASTGPAMFRCARVRTALYAAPREGLFQGSWHGSDADAAALAMPAGPAGTLRMDCDNASLDLHQADDGRWLLALDGQVLRWQVEPAPASPGAAVRSLLLRHLSAPEGLGGLDSATLSALQAWLAPTLRASIRAWMARTGASDEVPELSGDPFLDAQEMPSSVSLGRASVKASRARVPVTLVFEGAPARVIDYRMTREQGRWLLHDIGYGTGPSLRRLLAP